MAKKSMNMKVKSVKREKKKVVERTAKDEAKSFAATLIGVLVFLGVCYLGVLGMQALGVFDKFSKIKGITKDILKEALFEFPIEEIKVNMPEWIAILNHDHYLKKEYISKIKELWYIS